MKSKHFRIEEFVSKAVFDALGEKAWALLDPRLIQTMDLIKEVVGDRSVTINNWLWGGSFSQRGFRENTSQIVTDKTKAGKLYLSAHTVGMAADFDIKGFTAEQVRNLLVLLECTIPYKIRLEDGVSWVHLDVRDDNKEKVYIFKS